MRKFALYVLGAILVALPALGARLFGFDLPPLLNMFIFGLALLSAGFLLSWSAETAEEHVSQGLALAGLALVTILPEYAVDIYYSFQAGAQPGSEYVQFAAANMTGANRLLIGTAWPLIILLFWARTGRREVLLRPDNAVEIVFLALASLYSFVIVLKGQIDLFDAVALVGLYGVYLWRLSRLPRKEAAPADDDDDDDDDDDLEVGPAAALTALPARRQWAVIAALVAVAVLIIAVVAEPFAEALVGAGTALGINKFLLIQWIAPLAGEAPEIILTILFTLSLRPTAALGALVSDKINQWTLLVGTIPLIYSLGAGRLGALPLDARQHEEFFLTAAQSVYATVLLLNLRLRLPGALALLGLFAAQLGLGFVFRDDEATTITMLTALGWVYLLLAAGLLAVQWRVIGSYIRAQSQRDI